MDSTLLNFPWSLDKVLTWNSNKEGNTKAHSEAQASCRLASGLVSLQGSESAKFVLLFLPTREPCNQQGGGGVGQWAQRKSDGVSLEQMPFTHSANPQGDFRKCSLLKGRNACRIQRSETAGAERATPGASTWGHMPAAGSQRHAGWHEGPHPHPLPETSSVVSRVACPH